MWRAAPHGLGRTRPQAGEKAAAGGEDTGDMSNSQPCAPHCHNRPCHKAGSHRGQLCHQHRLGQVVEHMGQALQVIGLRVCGEQRCVQAARGRRGRQLRSPG